MLYFSHTDIENTYHVSKRTVHNWIGSAKSGRITLELYKKGSRSYIANTPDNLETLTSLAESGKKKRNIRYQKTVSPAPNFYKLLSKTQILDMISSIDIHRELPRQYNYFGEGAHNWDVHVKYLIKNKLPNLLEATVDLLKTNQQAISDLLANAEKVNIIDIGPGNAMPARGLMEQVLGLKKLNRYIAIDLSQGMLDIAETNIGNWFNGGVKFEGYIRDITHQRFDDIIVDDMLSDSSDKIINIALFMGGTPVNLRAPSDAIRTITNSLSPRDLVVYTDEPDNEAERVRFNFHKMPTRDVLSPNHRYMFDLLGIIPNLYTVETGFNEDKKIRYIRIRLNAAINIEFKFGDNVRLVKLDKDDVIVALRVWHWTSPEIVELFENEGLTLLQLSLTSDRAYHLSVYGINLQQELKKLAV